METSARSILIGIFVLLTVGAVFAFVYWLKGAGGLSDRVDYRIRFEGPVSGLQVGGAVQFNGIRVGEVTGLQLDTNDPRKVIATIAVARGTPVRADTHVDIDFQGLMGSPAISLRGGSAASPQLSAVGGEPPLLAADAEAGQDLSQAARAALQHVDKILSDNSADIKDTISNLKTFSGALARNSDKVDAIMTAVEHLAGGGAPQKPKPVYELSLSITPMPRATQLGPLAIAEPTAVIALQTQRMLVHSRDGELSQWDDAEWSDTLPKLVQAKLIQAFEDAGALEVVPQTEGIATTHQLQINLRRFALAAGDSQVAEIEFTAKLLGSDGHIIGAQLFQATAPVPGTDVAAIVRAFDQAFSKVAQDLLTWVAKVR
jgi:phospholipid/cholesterol/gamma-HCH transport system substrate-binding protein